MVAAKQLLDPSARDPKLRAFAYLQARFVKGARTAIDCLQPFLLYAIGTFDGEEFDREKLIQFLSDNYRINMPRYMLDDMIPHLMKLGALIRSEMADVITCKNIVDDDGDQNDDLGFSIEQIAEVEGALNAFARSQKVEKPYSSNNWGDAIISFFQTETTEQQTKTASIDGVMVTDTEYFDNQIIAKFIMDASRNSIPIYETIEKIFYGVLVNEFLLRIEATGNKAEYQGLNIIYDAPVLLRILGTSGAYLRTATLEMHQVLQDLGCNTFYFNHNFSELLAALDYIPHAYETGENINPETQQALETGEITIGKIAALLAAPDIELGTLNIVEHPVNYEDRKYDEFQINEQGFSEDLKRSGRYRYGSTATVEDAKSLALMMRARSGKTSANVAETKELYITHNAHFARRTRLFLHDQKLLPARAVSPVLTVGQMTTVGWLANEIIFEPQRVSKELIANCYSASLPMDGWGNAFWDALKNTDPAKAAEVLDNAFLVRSVQEIAQHETRGHVGLIRNLNMVEVLQQAEEKAKELEEQARSAGLDEGRELASTNIGLVTDERAIVISSGIARGIEVALFVGSVAWLIVYYFFLDMLGPVIGTIAGLVVVTLAVITIADIFNTKIPFSLKGHIEALSLKGVKRVQQYFGVR